MHMSAQSHQQPLLEAIQSTTSYTGQIIQYIHIRLEAAPDTVHVLHMAQLLQDRKTL